MYMQIYNGIDLCIVCQCLYAQFQQKSIKIMISIRFFTMSEWGHQCRTYLICIFWKWK